MNGFANRFLACHGSWLATLTALLWAFSVRLHAAVAGNLPWERPMQTIATSLTGPVAYAIGLIGIAIAGGTMLWSGELNFAAPMLASAFGVNAAVM